jgi:4-amino-4-deoxy-L-arabinose transferase-like glycosyltransferase
MPSVASMGKSPGLVLGVLLIFAAVFYSAGLTGDLPYAPYADEPIFVEPAVHIAATGNLNPGWFGNPGSTVIYPLAAIYHVWYSAEDHEPMFQRAYPGLTAAFQADPTPFYLFGRLLNLGYALLTICVLFAFVANAFNVRVAFLSVLFLVLNPLTLYYVHFVRTDIAASFFGALSVALLVRLVDRPSTRNQVLSGAAIGFGIGTRYFMGVLVPVLLFVDLLHVVGDRQRIRRRSWWLESAAGGVAVAIAFAISNPFFFVHFGDALQDIANEARTTHLGADGLSPIGNLAFYLTDGVTRSIAVPGALLALAGAGLIVARRQTRLYVLPVFVLALLVGLSLQHLHWDRWIIPAFPALAVLSAYGLYEILEWGRRRWNVRSWAIRVVAPAVLVLAAVGLPLAQSFAFASQISHPSTRVLARAWVLDNLPPGSRIVAQAYTAPDLGPGYVVLEADSGLEQEGIDALAQQGYQYIMVSANIYDRYYAEPGRYPIQIAFYDDLFNNYVLIHTDAGVDATPGSTIRIYELHGAAP